MEWQDAAGPPGRSDYWHKRYKELSQSVRMVRIAVEESLGAGIMSVGATPGPIEECEEIAKAIYKLGGKPNVMAETHKITKANVVRIRGDQYRIEFEFDDDVATSRHFSFRRRLARR